MCPNHVEQILEQKLLTSASLSERVKLWNNYTEIHGETVKLNFIKKVSRRTAPYRVKISTVPKNLVRVPESVKAMYKRPIDLIPNHNVISADRMIDCDNQSNETKSIRASEQEQQEWLSSLIEFQSEVQEYLKKSNVNETNCDQIEKQDQLNEFLNLNQDQIKLLAWEKYKEKINNQKSVEQSNQLNNSINDSITNYISLPNDNSLTYFSKANTVRRKEDDSINNQNVRARICPIIIENNLIKGLSVPMIKNSFTIGCDSSMDLNLVNYGHCNYLSGKHALIFYDEVKLSNLINFNLFLI